MGSVLTNVDPELALEVILKGVHLVGSCRADITNSVGAILRQEIRLRRNYPRTHLSQVDGYCVLSDLTSGASPTRPVRFPVKGLLAAGDRAGILKKGPCMAIMTGASLPSGADGVVKSEDVLEIDSSIEVRAPVAKWSNVTLKGSIVKRGDVIAHCGDEITPLLASWLGEIGVKTARVSRKVRIGLIGIGSELKKSGFASNLIAIEGFLARINGDVCHKAIVADDCLQVVRSIEYCSNCDLIVTTGGLGGSKYDLTRESILRGGYRIVIDGLQLRPGSHFVLARRNRQPIFALSGSPVAMLVCFHLLVLPYIQALGGKKNVSRRLKARLLNSLKRDRSATKCVPAHLRDDGFVEVLRLKAPTDTCTLSFANVLVYAPAGSGRIGQGSYVDVIPLVGVW